MGKRKERRLAALSAAGRRVKLDLFAEPYGNSGVFSVKDEVGGDNSDSKTGAKLPSSPSSTGKKIQNPLLLLGQYSDDELDGSLSAGHNECSEEPSIVIDDEAKIVGTKTTEDTEADDVSEPSIQTVKQLEMANNDSASKDPSPKPGKEDITSIGEAICPAPSEEQVVGDVSLGWKMVLHEESNQYYYWNIKTGETSWEVPHVLTHETVENCLEKPAGDADEKLKAVDADQGTETDGFDGRMDDSLDNEIGNTYADQNHETSLLNGDALVVNGTQANDSIHREKNRTGAELSLLLVKHCESLLERLNSVNGLNQQCQDFKLKSALEVETRLADIKALASHGSLLLPFWLHSEAQLKYLEAAIDNVIQQYDSASTSEYESTTLISREGIESQSKNSLVPKIEINGLEMRSELVSTKSGGDDVDMDVDMEVEDISNTNKSVNGEDASGAQYHHVQSEQLNPPLETWVPPLPPDHEPSPPPPPPPDHEPSPPPPPPDELADTSYPPAAPVQSFPYPEQYILQYPGSSLGYYGQTDAEVTGTALYTHSEGVQVAVSHIPHYYDPVSNVYAVEPRAYYGLQNGTLNPVPLVNGSAVESWGIQSEPALENVIDSDKLQSMSKLLPNTNVNVVKEPEVSDAQVIVEPQSTSDATTSVASKVQSKVTRTKKRASAVVPTLRSNKKVSSLVDKWKAAKEELQEDEEPKSAYETLEKKRQREIEEWRAQQIANGEAKDNANFQPLGGDWRERVKRKRALKMKETAQNNASETTESCGEPPDLIEYSRGLPSGWKAYWDESSKQVYYGNLVTSETSWSRPKD